ncbi:hypothetical protein pb186bvf_017781 [Paramecium bursaria]
MNQNVDSLIKKIRLRSQKIDINQLISLEDLKFPNSNIYTLPNLNSNQKLLFEDDNLKQSAHQVLNQLVKNEEIIYNQYMSQIIRQDQYNHFDLAYCVKTTQQARQIYEFITWILIHHKSYEMDTLMQVSNLVIYQQDKYLIILIGYNYLHSEYYMSLEVFRHYNYQRHQIDIPQVNYETFPNILKHYIIIIRRMQNNKDNDEQLNKVLSAYTPNLLENIQKYKQIPLNNNDQSEIFQFKLSKEALEQGLNYEQQKIMFLNIINMDILYLNANLHYAFIIDDKNLLFLFQYQMNLVKITDKQDKMRQIIGKIQKIIRNGIKLQNKKIQINMPLQTSQIQNILQSSLNTAMQWFDNNRFQLK